MYIRDDKIEEWIEEDSLYLDLTTELLEICEQRAKITFKSRDEIIVSGSEEVKRVIEKLGGEILFYKKSGVTLKEGDVIIEAKMDARGAHQAWKPAQNILEYACGVATETKELVTLAKSVNPNIEVLTTRKTIPSTKKLAIKSILAGGAYPHRLGISESILIFKQHMLFFGTNEILIDKIRELKLKALEKKIVLEVKDINLAFEFVEEVDILQFDKLSPQELRNATQKLKKINPNIKILSAGGINRKNIKEYSNSGVDGIVLSAPYYAKPANIGVEIIPL